MEQIIVNVGDLTIEEKQRVNEALAKIKNIGMCDPRHWDKTDVMYGPSIDGVNVGFDYRKVTNPTLTPQQVLEMAGMADQGHAHAESMALYAQDAKTHTEPWKLWQMKTGSHDWIDCKFSPAWNLSCEYRRKQKTKLIHGVEIPVFEFVPKVGEKYYAANVDVHEFFDHWLRTSERCVFTQRMIERGLVYPYTEEGKQAAILHSKAMLGIA